MTLNGFIHLCDSSLSYVAISICTSNSCTSHFIIKVLPDESITYSTCHTDHFIHFTTSPAAWILASYRNSCSMDSNRR